jgi:ABC-type transport system involved in cytochrome bd biosynthesis fused ATPase/permease subunit
MLSKLSPDQRKMMDLALVSFNPIVQFLNWFTGWFVVAGLVSAIFYGKVRSAFFLVSLMLILRFIVVRSVIWWARRRFIRNLSRQEDNQDAPS